MQTPEAELINFSDVSILVVLKAMGMKALMGFCLSMDAEKKDIHTDNLKTPASLIRVIDEKSTFSWQ